MSGPAPGTAATASVPDLYVSDVDHTLLDSAGSLSSYSRETLNRLLAEGLRFTVASARSCASLRHLLAFGDGANDIGLLQAAAVALAVANAVPDLKRHASAVIAANDDDAVARYASVHWRARRR